MVNIRQALPSDIIEIQNCNLNCLSENYKFSYFGDHLLLFPQLQYVAEDSKGRVVGYVLSQVRKDGKENHGLITSLAVLRTHRKLGLATKLMNASHNSMKEVFKAEFVLLHVRISNSAALHLYSETLGYIQEKVDVGYYGNEDAYLMKKVLRELKSDDKVLKQFGEKDLLNAINTLEKKKS